MEKATEKKVWALLKRCRKFITDHDGLTYSDTIYAKGLITQMNNLLNEQPKEHPLDKAVRHAKKSSVTIGCIHQWKWIRKGVKCLYRVCSVCGAREDEVCSFCGQVHEPMRKDASNTRVCNQCWNSWQHRRLYKEFKIVEK